MSVAVTLTEGQEQAVAAAVDAIERGEALFRIGGYAGTGKTTLIHEIRARASKRGAVCAYTGKAACVLRAKKVLDAQTIHSTIYHYDRMADQFFRRAPSDVEGDYFLVDEASMIGLELWEDLQSFHRPIIAVGDPGQLPPVSKLDVNLMIDPDILLTEIHRQDRDSGIVQLATEIRKGGHDFASKRLPAREGPDAVVTDKRATWDDESLEVLVCGLNKTRVRLNDKVRARQGRTGLPVAGERIICLSNDRKLGVFNGLMGTLMEPWKKKIAVGSVEFAHVAVHWDGEDEPRPTTISDVSLGQRDSADADTLKMHRARAVVCDYGYAITCHKSQGSQWDRVGVINQSVSDAWEQDRWLYTAVTRASKFVKVGR